MNVLIDTNVILDALIGRVPFHKAAEQIIVMAAEESIIAYITASSITDIYYILRKQLRNGEQAKQAIRRLMAIVTVLDVRAADCEAALALPMPDYEDALQVQCAARAKAEYIITRDKKHFEGSPVKAISPDDFLIKHPSRDYKIP